MTGAMGAALVAAAAWSILASTACSAQADERRFAAEMRDRVKARWPDAEVIAQADPLSVTIKRPGLDEAIVNFHRIYGYCRTASAADCASVRDEFLDKSSPGSVPKITAASLRLAVRDREYVDSVRAHVPRVRLIIEPIGEELFAVLVSDSADTVTLVPLDELATLGLTRQAAWQHAWRQTKAMLPALPRAGQLKIGAIAYEDQEYLPSLLIDLDAWKRIAAEAGADLFATAVADNFVFIGLMPAGSQLETFRKTVREDCEHQPRCISPHLYRFRNGRWVVAPR